MCAGCAARHPGGKPRRASRELSSPWWLVFLVTSNGGTMRAPLQGAPPRPFMGCDPRGGGVGPSWTLRQVPAARAIAAMPARTNEGRPGQAATMAANSGSVGSVVGSEPAPLLPDLLPLESETFGFAEGFRNSSDPIGVIHARYGSCGRVPRSGRHPPAELLARAGVV